MSRSPTVSGLSSLIAPAQHHHSNHYHRVRKSRSPTRYRNWILSRLLLVTPAWWKLLLLVASFVFVGRQGLACLWQTREGNHHGTTMAWWRRVFRCGNDHGDSYKHSVSFSRQRRQLPTPPHVSQLRRMFVDTYREAVFQLSDSQLMSWNMHVGMDRHAEGALADTNQNVTTNNHHPLLWDQLRHAVLQAQQEAGTSIPRGENNNNNDYDQKETDHSTTPDLIWDDESDFSTYMSELMQRCAANDTTAGDSSDTLFTDRCWGYLNALVQRPRCTTVLDSRVSCRRGRPGKVPQNMAAAARSLLRRHFQPDSLNVLILGAGPVGLQLANGLAYAQTTPTNNHTSPHHQSVRVVIFENRVASFGQKRPYSRDWMTDLSSEYFEGIVDPQLQAWMKNVHYPGKVRLALNAVETLLLLSNRRAPHIQILYDDFQSYPDIWAEVADNLIVFDATGHRLQAVPQLQWQAAASRRILSSSSSSVVDKKQVAVPSRAIAPWKWDDSKSPNWFPHHRFQCLEKYDSVVHMANAVVPSIPSVPTLPSSPPNVHRVVAARGDRVWYPVLPETGEPYHLRFLKINDLRLGPDDMQRLRDLRSRMINTRSPLCESRLPDDPCGVPSEQQDDKEAQEAARDTFVCRFWCSQAFVWDSSEYFREDIYNRMASGDHPGFAVQIALLALSPAQADALTYAMEGKLTRTSTQVVAASTLPFDNLMEEAVFQENNLDSFFRFFAQHPASLAEATASLFIYRPYLYQDPLRTQSTVVTPGHKEFSFPLQVPMLRVGDSLASGDPNRSTGLGFHVKLLHKFLQHWEKIAQRQHRQRVAQEGDHEE